MVLQPCNHNEVPDWVGAVKNRSKENCCQRIHSSHVMVFHCKGPWRWCLIQMNMMPAGVGSQKKGLRLSCASCLITCIICRADKWQSPILTSIEKGCFDISSESESATIVHIGIHYCRHVKLDHHEIA